MRAPKKRTHLYFCATFRNDWSRAFNLRLAERFEASGVRCYLPQVHSDQSGDRKRTYTEDVAGIDGAEGILAIGTRLQSANWGFEIGYAHSKGLPIVAITDEKSPFDLMTSGALSHALVLPQLDDIDVYWEELFSQVKKFLQ